MNDFSKKEKHNRAVNLLYVLPMLTISLLFILYPITQIFCISFFERKINESMTFVGLQNFADLFTDPDTPRMSKNTFLRAFVGVAFRLLLGLFVALILYKRFLGKKMVTAIILIPYAMSAAVSYMIWHLMYNPMFGHITRFLMDTHILGLPMDFLEDSKTSLIAVMIVNIWAVAPFCAPNTLSTMYSIPSYIYETAGIDGADGRQQFFSIILSLITSPVRALRLLIGIWAFNTFDVIYMTTQGGPANLSPIMVNSIYQNTFQSNNRGYSAAISMVGFSILSVFAVLYVDSKGEDTRYE